jgi:hypothetical protein
VADVEKVPAAKTASRPNSRNWEDRKYPDDERIVYSNPSSVCIRAVTFMNGATVLGTGSLASGSATFEISTLKVGETPITAAYDGDTNFSSSTSNVVRQEVKKAN